MPNSGQCKQEIVMASSTVRGRGVPLMGRGRDVGMLWQG